MTSLPSQAPSFEVSVSDGITLRGLRYSSDGAKKPIVCLPGLTRNAADFEDLAPLMSATGRDVYAISLRGRGRSDYDPDYRNYNWVTYRDDIIVACQNLNLNNAIFIGTSLGGITAMLVNEKAPTLVSAAIINDVGPTIAAEGVARIASYVGVDGAAAANIDEAAARIKAINEVAFPDANDEFWIRFAKRTFREENGSWTLDYDPNIAKAFGEPAPALNLWPAFESLKTKPTLIVRGEHSDILTTPIVEEMRNVHPHFDYAEAPGIGHAPTLTEPAIWSAINRFLSTLE